MLSLFGAEKLYSREVFSAKCFQLTIFVFEPAWRKQPSLISDVFLSWVLGFGVGVLETTPVAIKREKLVFPSY